ncbi:MAG: cytochrome c biogenesis protein CcsA [Proteobacteria bacterium]|nr:cytochrome c biogenesis protein CcsA [Pseudomonadota bacterium]
MDLGSFPAWGEAALVAAFVISLIWVGLGRVVLRRAPAPYPLFLFVPTFLFVLVTLAFASLMWAYVTGDFSLKNVFENAHTHTPLLYKVAGVWGNHEGSMLLWMWLLSLYGCLFVWMGRSRSSGHLAARAAASWIHNILFVMGMGYCVFMSSPFERMGGALSQGLELNPLLQDPALAIHPPLLYTGCLGLSLVFACTVAGTDTLARAARRWTLWAWSTLTLGIMLGSFWAYYELGWGGWWFWDPVENASLMPWLCATALLHLRHTQAPFLTRLLSVGAFSFCLLGLTLVRSGVLSTVHAFASDPQRGAYLGVMTVLVALWGILSVIKQTQDSSVSEKAPAFWSRASMLKLQALLFMTLLFIVVLATLYPLVLEALTGGTITVGTPYFVKTFVPVAFVMLLMMGAAPFFARADAGLTFLAFKARVTRPGLVALLMGSLLLYAWHPFEVTTFVGLCLVFWTVTGTITYVWRKRSGALNHAGMLTAHVGVAVMVFGMCVQTHGEKEHLVALGEGEKTIFMGREVTLQEVEGCRAPTYMAEKAHLVVGGRVLTPEKRFYPGREILTSETALLPQGMSLFYAALGGLLPDNRWSIRLFYHPQVIWIWVGAMMMALGGGISLISLRRRRKKT